MDDAALGGLVQKGKGKREVLRRRSPKKLARVAFDMRPHRLIAQEAALIPAGFLQGGGVPACLELSHLLTIA